MDDNFQLSDSDSNQPNDQGPRPLAADSPSSSSLPTAPAQGITRILLGVGLGVALTLGATHWLKPQSSDPTPAISPVSSVGLPHVTVTAAVIAPIQQLLEATGTVAAAELLAVRSPSSGLQIQQVLIEEGDLVRQGQVLAILDSTVLQAQFREAQAQVREAEAQLAELRAGSRVEEIDRARAEVRRAEAEVKRAESDLNLATERVQRNQTLANEGAIASDRLDEVMNQSRSSQSGLEQAQAELQQAIQQLAELEAGPRLETIAQAQAQLDASRERVRTLQAQLEDTQVLAPRSGKIAERLARVGDVASPSNQLFSIIDNQQLELLLEIPETQLPQIRLQQGVRITSDANPDLRLSGRVQEINPLIDPASRIATVKVSLPASDLLRPGMFLRGAIITSAHQGLTLPAEAVLPQPDGSHLVYTLNSAQTNSDQTVTAKSVEIGELLPNQHIEIKQGLLENDQVVVKGAAYLGQGDRVEIVK